MRNSHLLRCIKTVLVRAGISALLFCICLFAHANGQSKSLAVYAIPGQGLAFGAFFYGPSGGTVNIAADGSRTVTGNVIAAAAGGSFSAALFEVQVESGTQLSILNGPDVLLTGNNGGSMTMHTGAASTGPSFQTTAIPPLRTQVRIGGTLTVGNQQTSPPGTYSGTFSITFIQQ